MNVKLEHWLDFQKCEMENNFTIDKDFVLRYRRRNYTHTDIAQAVGYWLDKINNIGGNRPIGISYATLSFSSIAFLLALYKSGRSFMHLGVIGNDVSDSLLQEQELDAIFVVGDLFHSNVKLDIITNQLYHTDTWDHAYNCVHWQQPADLTIPFRNTQIIYAYTSGSTGRPKPVSMSSYYESLSIKCAMDLFFVEDDYCVFAHGMSHMGVHTTAILPGLFKARVVSLADHTWDEEILHASHIQYFSTMTFLQLPKQLRVLTTGGNSLKRTFLEQIHTQCQVDNIYDVYGLTECLPPLAVRNVKSIEDLSKPFTWVNADYFATIEQGCIKITRPDGQIFVTSDQGSIENDQLTFLGRANNLIRVNGNLVTVEEFQQIFETETKVVNYAIENHNNEFLLYGLQQDCDAIINFVQKSNATVLAVFKDTLLTNGGIKSIGGNK